VRARVARVCTGDRSASEWLQPPQETAAPRNGFSLHRRPERREMAPACTGDQRAAEWLQPPQETGAPRNGLHKLNSQTESCTCIGWRTRLMHTTPRSQQDTLEAHVKRGQGRCRRSSQEGKQGENCMGRQARGIELGEASARGLAGGDGCRSRRERLPLLPRCDCRGYTRPLTAGTAPHRRPPPFAPEASHPRHSPLQACCRFQSARGAGGPPCARGRPPPARSPTRMIRAQEPVRALSHGLSPTRKKESREPPQRRCPLRKQEM
jgi:hypothetical protein